MTKCKCCKTNDVDMSKGQTTHCDNCWYYMMGKDELKWGDIWTLICHWHATHEEGDKDFDFAHDIILTAYSNKHYGHKESEKCDMDLDRFHCEFEKNHRGSHAVFF